MTKCVPVSSTRTNQRSSFQNASEVVPTQSTNEKTSENESSERKNQLAVSILTLRLSWLLFKVQFRQVDEVMECFNDRPFPEVDSAPFDQESVQKLTFLGNQLKENLHWIKDRSFTTQEIHEFAEYIGLANFFSFRQLLFRNECGTRSGGFLHRSMGHGRSHSFRMDDTSRS